MCVTLCLIYALSVFSFYIYILNLPFPFCLHLRFHLLMSFFCFICQDDFLIGFWCYKEIWACSTSLSYRTKEWVMEELAGAFGTSASLALRLGQTVFSSSSLLLMCLDVGFYSYTAFWYFTSNFDSYLLILLPFLSLPRNMQKVNYVSHLLWVVNIW